VLERLNVEPDEAVMVGDSIDDDVEGARVRSGCGRSCSTATAATAGFEPRLDDLRALPAALGLNPL
jgi:phosphoglycolate phosphatase-like HAD superfamily hydrolase